MASDMLHRLPESHQPAFADPDMLVLEEALRRVSGGTMEAMIDEVVKVAAEEWGYPCSLWAARRSFRASADYEVIDGFVRPKREPRPASRSSSDKPFRTAPPTQLTSPRDWPTAPPTTNAR